MVIVQHFPGSVKDYVDAVCAKGRVFALPERCPHPDCRAVNCLIRWGTYQRWARWSGVAYCLTIQRVRCKVCDRTHSLLPDFLSPYRHYVIHLLQHVVSLYLLASLSWERLMEQWPDADLPRSTVREWVGSFVYGAGELLLDWLRRQLLSLAPLTALTEASPERLQRGADSIKQRRLDRAHLFWQLAEQLYAQVKARLPHLHFAAQQLFPFLLHWLQRQGLPPRLFWSPALSNTPSAPF
jgi:hypothetical protein